MRIVLALLLFLLSCARPPAVPSRAVPRAHPADDIRGARLVPASALAFVTTADLGKLVDALGRRELRDRFASAWEQASFELVERTGWDLTSPELLGELGIDVAGEAGAALLPSERGAALAIYFGLSKPAIFKNALYRALDGRDGPEVIRPSPSQPGRIVVGDGDAAVVLSGDQVFVVIADEAREVARALAALDAASSLSRQRAFRIAMRATPRYSPLRGYLDLRGLAYLAGGVVPRVGGHDRQQVLAQIEQQQQGALSRARARGASVDELVAIDDHHERMRQRIDESALRAWLGGIEGAGLSLTVHPDGLDLMLSIDAEDSPLRALLRPSDAGRRFAQSLDRPVLALASLSFDGPALSEALRRADVDEVAVRQLLGADLDAGIGALGGALSIGVLLPEGGLAAITDRSDLSLVAQAPLRDPAAAKALLRRLADSPLLGRAEVVDGDLLVHDGDFGPLRVGVRGDRLLAAPDAATLDALAEPRAAPRRAAPSTAMRMAERSAAFSLLVHMAALVLPEVRLPSGAAGSAAEPPWHDTTVPKSEAYRAKLAELQAVDAELRAIATGDEQARFQRIAAALAPLGSAAVSLSPSDHGMRLEATYRTRKRSMASVLADLVEAGRSDGEVVVDREQLDALFSRRAQLEAELESIYTQDANR